MNNRKKYKRTLIRNFYSKEIRKLRKGLKLTQTEFADKIGVSLTSVTNYECGKTIPSLKTLKNISEYIGDEADYLFCIDSFEKKR